MPIPKRVLIFLSCCFIFSTTYARSNTNLLFYCQTTKGKQIKVVKQSSVIIYTYGKNLKAPELSLKKKLSEVQIYSGPYQDGKVLQITIPNKQYAYTIYSGYTAKGKFNYLSVTKNETEIAEFECQDSTVRTTI